MVESYLIFSFFTVYVNNWLPVFSLFVVEPLIHLLVSKVHACTDLFWALPSFGDSSFHRVAMFPFACFSCHWVDIFRFVLLHRPIVLFLTCLFRQRWIRVISPFPAAFDSNSFTLFHCSFLLAHILNLKHHSWEEFSLKGFPSLGSYIYCSCDDLSTILPKGFSKR